MAAVPASSSLFPHQHEHDDDDDNDEHVPADSQDYDVGGQTQTQTQTQPTQSTQSTPAVPAFPAHLFGILVSTSTSPAVTTNGHSESKPPGYVEREARFELVRGVKAKEMYTVGRKPSSDLVLGGKKISSEHARIWFVPNAEGETNALGAAGTVMLFDNSTNGTFVSNKKVGKGKTTQLENGDEVIFGPPNATGDDFRYIFQGPAKPSTLSEPRRPGEGGGIYEQYDVREPIGKGSFATVSKGIQRTTGKMVAIKVILKARFASNPKTMEMISREVGIMKALDHKYCVRYIDYFEDDQKMFLVMEYVDGGDLLDYVMTRGGLQESETREIALMVCEAVAYLHSKGVAHRDLKPENLLLSKGLRPLCKVTDFGLAKMVDNNTMLRTMCGTPTYLAPGKIAFHPTHGLISPLTFSFCTSSEVILGNDIQAGYNSAVDAWSIGVVLYSCLANATPFDESESTPLQKRIEQRQVDLSTLEELGVSEMARDFLGRLMVKDPKYRMSVQDALEHPWLATVTADGVSVPALPLLISSLPFNAAVGVGTRGGDKAESAPHRNRHRLQVEEATATGTASNTSRAVSAEFGDSFVYSQQLHNLRLVDGTPRRSTTGYSQTTPDKYTEDGATTENGVDQTEGIPTPLEKDDRTLALATGDVSMQIAEDNNIPIDDSPIIPAAPLPAVEPSSGTKRKEPPSAFSSSSSLEPGKSHSTEGARNGSLPMSIDQALHSPPAEKKSDPAAMEVVAELTPQDDEGAAEEEDRVEKETVESPRTMRTRAGGRRVVSATVASGEGSAPRRRGRKSAAGTPPPAPAAGPVEELLGPTTKRRSKAARLS